MFFINDPRYIIYIITQNTFSFDISLRVTIKCVGTYADNTLIQTGILMGTHKLKFFMVTAVYVLSICPFSTKNYMKADSALIRIVVDIQMSFMICLYIFFLVWGFEEHFLQIFLWIMTKCMTSVIFDIDYFLCYFFHVCRRKGVNSNMNVEEFKFQKIIEMKETQTIESS